MPLINEAPSGAKGRFGFHGRGPAAPLDSSSSSYDPAAHSPDSTKPVPGDNNSRDLAALSVVKSFDFDEDPSFWQDHNVQVIIRVRPLSTSEISVQGHGKCVRQESSQAIAWTGQPETRFTFDLVADETVSQEKLFKVAGVPMVENCMGGYNSCMFAYGQTGSGKTHTMLGDIENGTRRHSVNCGMTPRIFEYLFSRIQKEKDARQDDHLKFTCKCSFLEIYNEQILDLLDPSSSNLQLREDVKKGVYVENLKETEVASCRDVVQQLIQGAANRKVAATNMNHASSRSHSVFTCIIESQWESQGVTHHRFARLNLVDLAGSERQKSSGAEGERLKEATNINKSLSTLGLVIMNLVSMSNGKSLHVPYRDSKLTFLLQDSLGGNSKTTIIANISPSLCCSSETLSTLKFAQRAKFIKNNAIVNEDASGDVIAMRLQIQQLKKEVARLRGLNNGAENADTDTSALGFPGSPESLKWGGLSFFSPLASAKKSTQKKDYDYEVALVGALRRVNDKDISLKALEAENQTAMHLVKQREDEIQSLKMRLRFREAAVKRLETMAAGKISAETHLLAEKEEHLREIEVLRNQVDRSQEVTRFAMENLQLKEEIRKLKSFHEGGERAMMSGQIMVLQNKLLEALDWKLMHQSEMRLDADDDLLVSTQGSESPRRSSIKQENDFLMQVEIDTLRKQLDICLAEKENLERHVSDLAVELQEERSSRATNGGLQQIQLPSFADDTSVGSNDQLELKTMVDAIAAASEREAEAHHRAFTLSKENDDMQLKLRAYTEENNTLLGKLKEAIEEKNSIIQMYERAASASKSRDMSISEKDEMSDMEIELPDIAESKEIGMKLAVEMLEHELREMHEENEKLMALYEKAMLERDEFKRMVSSAERSRTVVREQRGCGLKLVIAEGEHNDFCVTPGHVNSENHFEEASLRPSGLHVEHLEMQSRVLSDVRSDLSAHNEFDRADKEAALLQESNSSGLHVEHLEMQSRVLSDVRSDLSGHNEFDRADKEAALLQESNLTCEGTYSPQTYEMNENDMGRHSHVEMGDCEALNMVVMDVSEDSLVLEAKLKVAENKLQDYANAEKEFGHIEDSFDQFDKLLEEQMEKMLQENRQELISYKVLSSELQERAAVSYEKLSKLRGSQAKLLSKVGYFEQLEVRERVKFEYYRSLLEQKSQKLASLKARKGQVEAAMLKIHQSDRELRNNLGLLKCKAEVENRRHEEEEKVLLNKKKEEKVLLAIDNVDNADNSRINWHYGATDLLKSEEEKPKLQTEINKTREELGRLKEELDDLKKKSGKIEREIQAVEADICEVSKAVKDKEIALHSTMQVKEALSEIRKNGTSEIGSMIIEYQQNVFDSDLKEAEIKVLEMDLLQQSGEIEQLRSLRAEAAEKMKMLFQGQK